MTEETRDRWARWLREGRHGGDPERQRQLATYLAEIRERVLDRAGIAAGDTVLDVGCGDGLIGFGALDRVGPNGRVVFSDISTELLDGCRTHAVEAGVDRRCEFVQASADDLGTIGDATVDVVTTRSVLIYVGDKQSCFDEFNRVLRAGGRMSGYEPINAYAGWQDEEDTYCGYDVAPVAELAAKVRALYTRLQPEDTDPMLDFDERDLLRAAERSGFDEIHLELRVDIAPRIPPVSWASFRNSAGNPRIPTQAEAIAATLTSAEADRFEAHLRPLVESGFGRHRLAVAHLWATKQRGR